MCIYVFVAKHSLLNLFLASFVVLRLHRTHAHTMDNCNDPLTDTLIVAEGTAGRALFCGSISSHSPSPPPLVM